MLDVLRKEQSFLETNFNHLNDMPCEKNLSVYSSCGYYGKLKYGKQRENTRTDKNKRLHK